MKPIADKAEVAIDFPDKTYMGSFGRESKLDARVDATGMMIKLIRTGADRREFDLHLHHGLFAEIIDELAGSVADGATIDDDHRKDIADAARRLLAAIEKPSA